MDPLNLCALAVVLAALAEAPGDPSPLRPAPRDLLLDDLAGMKGLRAPAGLRGEAGVKYTGSTFRFGLDGKAAPIEDKLPGKGLTGQAAIGPDGWLYVAAPAGDHQVTGSDGSKAQAFRTGAVFRCRPDGSRMHLFAIGLHSPGRPAFDLGGNVFLLDAGIPHEGSFSSGWLIHVVEGGDYGFRLGQGDPRTNPGPCPHRACWLGEKPGTLGPMLKYGKGPATPLFVYNDSRLPERFRGLLLHPDPVGRRVRAYRLEASGATFSVSEEFELLYSKDEGLKPVQAGTGPDGALYILDQGSGGRLIRLTWAGTKDEEEVKPRPLDTWDKLVKLEDAELVKALDHEDAGAREVVRAELVRRGAKVRDAVRKQFGNTEATLPGQIAALGVLQAMPDASVLKLLGRVTLIGEPELRSLAASLLARLAEKGDKEVNNVLLRGLADEDSHAKRAIALAMGQLAGPGAGENLASTLSFDNGKDPVLTLGLAHALERLGKPGVAALIALADSGSQKEIDRVADLFPGLRSEAAFAALPGMLKNPHMTAPQRAALALSAARYLSATPTRLDDIAREVIDNPKEQDAVRAALLQALGTPGVTASEKVAAWAVKQVESADEAVRIAAAAAVANLRPAGGGEALMARLEKAGKSELSGLATALAAYPDEKSERALRSLLDVPDAGPAALLALPTDRASETARKWLESDDTSRQKAAAAVLCRDSKQACDLAGQILKEKLPGSLRREVLTALRRHAARSEEARRMLIELSR